MIADEILELDNKPSDPEANEEDDEGTAIFVDLAEKWAMCIECLPSDDHSNMEVVDIPRILLSDGLKPRTLPQTL